MKQARQNGDDMIATVRMGDYDRFLAIQLAPHACRAGLYALTAFHVEIARIAETVSEPLIGHIRLAWWREALEEIASGKPARNHPVVLALAALYPIHPDIFPQLSAMLEARAADLDTSLIAQESAWLEYCDNTAGALHMAWAQLLGVDAAHAEVIRTQARAYAMVGLVRAIPFMAHQGWLRFPHARMNAHGLIELGPSRELTAFSNVLMADARALMQTTANPRLPKSLRALAALAQLHLRQLAHVGGDPYQLRPQKLAAVWCIILVNIK